MNEPTALELLRAEIESLPADLAAEVIDFIVFLKARRAEEADLWREVEAAHSRRDANPGDVRTVTLDEWDAVSGGERDGR